jgi:primase-polymerase (primpol)-like protein
VTPRARAPQKAPPANGPLKVSPWQIPAELRHHQAWAVWKYEYENNRWSKPPYQPSGEKAEPSDPSTWCSFPDALEAYQAGDWSGISFALDERWGLVGVDLDHISAHRADAARIMTDLNSYSETTPSGDGLRLFVRGHLPEGRRRRDWVEMYTRRRFLTVTGQHIPGTPTEICPSPRLYDTWQRWLQQGMRNG